MKIHYTGKVIEGDGIAGRDFDAPTANLDLPEVEIETGVYAALAQHDGNDYHACVCYGVGEPKKFEVHLFDFDQDIIGHQLSVQIVEKVSELVPWQSNERMRQKILHDLQVCKKILKKKK